MANICVRVLRKRCNRYSVTLSLKPPFAPKSRTACTLGCVSDGAFFIYLPLFYEKPISYRLLVNKIIEIYYNRIEIRFTSPIKRVLTIVRAFYYTQIQRLFLVTTKLQAYLSTSLFITLLNFDSPK